MEDLNQNEKMVWSCWEIKTPREVVREAAAKGTHIYLAHKYLSFKQGWDSQTTKDWFNAEVHAWVLQLLSRKQYFKASHVLNKMQIPPHKHMFHVAEESLDSDFRDYVVEQLIKTANDLQKESPDSWKIFINHWNLLKLLEKSFEIDRTLKQNRAFGIGKDMTIVTSSEVKCLTILKLQSYSDEWKKKIASYLFLEKLELSIIDFIDAEYFWKILIQQNKAMLLKRWILIHHSKDKNICNEAYISEMGILKTDLPYLDSLETLKELDKLFIAWNIYEDMLALVNDSDCFSFTKQCIYDALCSFGHIVESEKNDLKSILLRISRIQSLPNTDKLFSRCTSTINRTQWNNMLAEYCVDHNEYHAMTICVDFNLLNKKLDSEIYSPTNNCLDLWILFKEVTNDKNIKAYISLIYEACRYISDDGIDNYISNNPILILSMILFEGNMSIFEVFNENRTVTLQNIQINWNNPFSHALPHLYSVFQRSKNNTLIIENDVNVYQLLSGYKGLDISKIFEFQLYKKKSKVRNRRSFLPSKPSGVTDADENVCSYFSEMPNFSNPKLVRKYGYQTKLNYVYYLKQNRPCMASQALWIQQYQCFGRLSFKVTQEACAYAHTMALQNWNDPVITASCISFIAMIGGDSIKCRTHMTCVQTISTYLESFESKTKDEIGKYVSRLMEQLILNEKESLEEIMALLEKATSASVQGKINTTPRDYNNLSITIHEWQNVIRFAYFHNLPLPTTPLQIFVREDFWLGFVMFGDIFKYPKHTMLALSREFCSQTVADHIRHAISNPLVQDFNFNEGVKSKEDLRKISKESFVDIKSANSLDFSLMSDLWEVMANCHGPEDPPGALLKASSVLHCPVLALLATCYEPDAVETCWAHWLLNSMRKEDGEIPLTQEGLKLSPHMQLTDQQIQRIMEICLEAGYYKTLYESFMIFYRESSLCDLLNFIIQAVMHYNFDNKTRDLLKYFNDKIVYRVSLLGQGEIYGLPRWQMPKFIQTTSVNLIIIALSKGLKCSAHQKAFLDCLCETQYAKEFIVPHPDFQKLASLLDISRECNIKLDLYSLCKNNAVEYQTEYTEILIKQKMYEKALQFAKIVELPVESILISDWTERYTNTYSENNSQFSSEQSLLKFWGECSLAFKNCNSNPVPTIQFLKAQCDLITDASQKFYFLRLILSWFSRLSDDAMMELSHMRDQIEFEMWMSYLSINKDTKLYLLNEDFTYDIILNDKEILEIEDNTEDIQLCVFNKLLHEIDQESNIFNLSITSYKLSVEETERWCHAIAQLLEGGFVIEAWRLARMFGPSPVYSPRPLCSLELLEMCLRMAEGIITPYDLPQSLRTIVSSFLGRKRFSDSECSDTSFEELVLIADKQEESPTSDGHLAGRCEADCLSALEALASKSGLKILKKVANMYRISLQIGWPYERVLKFDGNPLDLINNLSGRSRMPLAKVILRSYRISTQMIVEYLCLEIVKAVVSPHLRKTPDFRQKEHFHYTLWGYPLDSDFEMFLNLRPDDNSFLGRLIIDHLSAFRKLYKTDDNVPSNQPRNSSEIDVEEVIDEEYQNIEDDEVESVISQQSESTIEQQPYQLGKKSKYSTESQSVMSDSIYSRSNFTTRSKKPQFDVISCTNIRVKSSVKSNMKSLLRGVKLSTKQVNIICIELLVLAHECFSSSCDTEGIAMVLRSAQTLTSHLLSAKSWRLMVRLLTGLARYTEMAYIFQMLRDNHQFEFLLGQFDYMLGQQEEKISNFKQGLLEFLKNHCPGDTEIYCLVALHFSMYSEAADVKKKQVNDLIVTLIQMALNSMKALKKKSSRQPEWVILANNDSNRLLLDTAINHCTDSAELYCKAGCLGAAREMAGLAQLLALQISLLSNPPTKCILNLSQEKIIIAIDSHLSFMEGLVFVLASDGGGGGWTSRWKELVYQRALRGDDAQFIKDIALHRPDVAFYIFNRYENEKKFTTQGDLAIADLKACFK